MYYEFEISAKLPGLNDYIHKLNRNKYEANRFKADTESLIGWYVVQARKQGYLPSKAINKPLSVKIEWHEENRRRDLDNVMSAKKFIFDALQKYGVIEGDGQKYITEITETVTINPPSGVVVRLVET